VEAGKASPASPQSQTEPRCAKGKTWRKKVKELDTLPDGPLLGTSAGLGNVESNGMPFEQPPPSAAGIPGIPAGGLPSAKIGGKDLSQIEDRVTAIASDIKTGPTDGLPILTAELAQLEATAKELSASGATGAPSSEHIPPGESQRLMQQRFERLFCLIDQTLAEASARFGEPPPADSPKNSSPEAPNTPTNEASFSAVSKESLAVLYKTNTDLVRIEQRVAEIATTISAVAYSEISQLRTELAALESQAKKLETVGVDNVYTGEMNSGRVLAKQSKKEMLQRFDELFSLIDTMFQEMRARESKEKASQP